MTRAADHCLRDADGFCRVAMLGHPACWKKRGCTIVDTSDAIAAYDTAYDRAITAIFRAYRRRQRERRR